MFNLFRLWIWKFSATHLTKNKIKLNKWCRIYIRNVRPKSKDKKSGTQPYIMSKKYTPVSMVKVTEEG